MRYQIKDLIYITIIVGVALGWFVNRQSFLKQIDRERELYINERDLRAEITGDHRVLVESIHSTVPEEQFVRIIDKYSDAGGHKFWTKRENGSNTDEAK